MNKTGVFLLLSILLLSNVAGAQDKIYTDGLSDEQKAQLALDVAQMKSEAEEKSILPSTINPKELNEWVDLGKNIGLAVAATAKELGVASDTFLQSTTGKITVVLIVWKVMGEDILGVLGGTAAWFIIVGIILWSFHFFHMTKKVVNKESGEVTYIERYDFDSNDAKTFAVVAHIVAFVGITLICMDIIF